ncbi:MAG: non-homologous end-joining DNA ligase [Candidatus Hadarchaeales archaeon]
MGLPILKPMLAKMGSPSDLKRKNFIWEPKLDGTRALVYREGEKVGFLNRRGKWIEYRYPELSSLSSHLLSDPCLLDGEIVVFGENGLPNFPLLQEREHQENPLRIEFLSRLHPATLVVFDLLIRGREELFSLPLLERKKLLSETVQEGERIRLCLYTKQGEDLWESVKKMGLEGVMGKREDSPYRPGVRSPDWLKLKTTKTLDAIILGYTPGEGQRTPYFGALALGAYHGGKLVFLGKVGTGFDTRLMEELTPLLKQLERRERPVEEEPPYEVKWVEPKLVCEVKYLEITEDLKLRAPSFVRMKEKDPQECELELEVKT